MPRRMLTQVEKDVWASDNYYTETQIFLGDIAEARSYIPSAYLGYNPFGGATVDGDLDDPLTKAEFRFKLGLGAQSLSPYMTGGMWVNGRPLFDPGRYIILNTRNVGRYTGAPPADQMPWRSVFSGRIDTADPGDDGMLHVNCRDWLSDWMDLWVPPNPDTGSWPITGGSETSIFTQLQSIILSNPWPTAPASPSPYFSFFSPWPTALIPSYNQEPKQGLLALRDLALVLGGDLRGRFWQGFFPDGRDSWALSFGSPDRALTSVDWEYGPTRRWLLQGLAKSRDEVRNYVSVTPAEPPRSPQVAEDTASQLAYGWKPLWLGEDYASRIVTPAQALALAQAILLDLAQPKIAAVLTVPYNGLVSVNDILRISPNFRQTDREIIAAVSGFHHDIGEDGSAVTTLRTRDTPAAANAEWRGTKPKMIYTSTNPPTGVAAEGARWIQKTSAT